MTASEKREPAIFLDISALREICRDIGEGEGKKASEIEGYGLLGVRMTRLNMHKQEFGDQEFISFITDEIIKSAESKDWYQEIEDLRPPLIQIIEVSKSKGMRENLVEAAESFGNRTGRRTFILYSGEEALEDIDNLLTGDPEVMPVEAEEGLSIVEEIEDPWVSEMERLEDE